MRGTWFFFYGTLCEDHDNPVTRAVLPVLTGGERAWTHGSLRAVFAARGWYPALCDVGGRVQRARARVTGRLYRAGPGFGLRHLRLLDAYEMCDARRPGWSEYRRCRVSVRAQGRAAPVRALAYVRARPAHCGMPVIADGDFARFLRRRRARAYGAL